VLGFFAVLRLNIVTGASQSLSLQIENHLKKEAGFSPRNVLY
jgi:hypothetical protein